MNNKFIVISFNPETGENHWDRVLAEDALKASEWIKKVRRTEVVAVFSILLLLELAGMLTTSKEEDIHKDMNELEWSKATSTEFESTPNESIH